MEFEVQHLDSENDDELYSESLSENEESKNSASNINNSEKSSEIKGAKFQDHYGSKQDITINAPNVTAHWKPSKQFCRTIKNNDS